MMPDRELSPRLRALLEDFRAGRRTALARVISVVEDERPGFQSLLDALHPLLGRGHRIGITGPPGAGKSTLSSTLIERYRARGEAVGVLAVDPSSPYTGGALLGDRIRMNQVAEDREVFIRSMASRGSLGGLAVTTKEVADLMDAFGFDRVLLETVGVGQSELDIVAAADSTVVVLVPESGDSIQAMKAGLMEIADIFVINKSDRPGAERLAREVEMMLHLRRGQALRNVPAHHGVDLARAGRAAASGGEEERRRAGGGAADTSGRPGNGEGPPPPDEGWEIPVLRTVAETGEGSEELVATLDAHRSWLEESGELRSRRLERLRERVREAVRRELLRGAWSDGEGERILAGSLDEMAAGRATPYRVAARIVRAALASAPVPNAGDRVSQEPG